MSGLAIGGIFAVLVLGAVLVWYFFFRKKASPPPAPGARTYQEVKEVKGTKTESGKCDGTGTKNSSAKSADACAAACTSSVSPACNGYDWDETTCNLYADIPKKAKHTSGGKDKCYAANLTK